MSKLNKKEKSENSDKSTSKLETDSELESEELSDSEEEFEDGREIEIEEKNDDDEDQDEIEELNDEGIEEKDIYEFIDEKDKNKKYKCLYDYTTGPDIDDFTSEILLEDNDNSNKGKIVNPDDRITKPILYRFERVDILGTRATQLENYAKPMLKGTEGMSSKMIANEELQKKMIPYIILRHMPNGKIEKWYLRELKIIN